MLQLEEILGTNDLPFQAIWFAANHGMPLASGRHRITKRIIMGVNVERSCNYLCTLEAPLTLQIQSSLLSGLVRVHHRQCDIHFAAVKGLWQNIQRELGTCRQINIDTTRTMARLQSITLQDNGSPIGMVLSDAVHPFENLIDKDNFRPDWFFNLRPCEKHYSHIYTTDASLVESPPFSVLPSTRLEFDDLEFDIQDAISIDNDEGSIGSRTWKTIGHHQEMEENLSLIGISDTIWHSTGEHEETLSQVRGQDILPRPLAISLPGVNEALSDSTILKPSSVNHATEDQATMGITDQDFDANESIEILRGMGVYQEYNLSQFDIPDGGALRSRRQYVRHTSASGSQVELTPQQLASMLSGNHYRRTRERHDQKKHLEVIRKKFHELLYHPGCQAYATELKEVWTSREKRKARGDLDPDYAEERQAIHQPEVGRQVQDENEMVVACALADLNISTQHLFFLGCSSIMIWKPTEDPEEARGHFGESSGEVFLWNQPEYLSDDSYGTRESRAGSVAKSLASISSFGLNPISDNEARPSASREFPALDMLPEHGEERSSIEDFEFPISFEIDNPVESRNFPHWSDQETHNFFSYTCKLLSSTDSTKIVFRDLFPDMTRAKRVAVCQAFINILSMPLISACDRLRNCYVVNEPISHRKLAISSQGLLHVQQVTPYSDILISL